MADRPKGTTLSKQRLQLDHFELDVPYSQGTKQLDRVQAVNLSLPEGDPLANKPLRMTIFNQELKTFVRGKGSIIADVEERPRPESDYGPDRTIVQVYDDQGQPVSRKQPGGGGGSWKRSLEDDLALEGVKRLSIEGQTAIAQVGNLLTCQSDVNLEELALDPETWARILGKYWKAVEQSLDNFLAGPTKTTAAKPAQATAAKPDQRPPGQRQAAPPSAEVSKDPPPPANPVKHVGDLLTRAGKLVPPVNPAEVATACGVTRPDELKDLEAAWKKVQAYSKKKANPSDPEWDKLSRPTS